MNRIAARFLVLALLLQVVGPFRAHAYYDDVHYALTYYIARQSGYTSLQAYRIASACSAVDWDPDTEPVQPIGQVKVLFDKALATFAIGTRLLFQGSGELLLGFHPLENGAEVPRWKYHAMRNEAIYRDVIGRGGGSGESQPAVLQQREALLRFAIEHSKNPGVFLHGFEDEAPHHGYGTRWGHWPILEGEADRHGSMPIGGTTDWVSFRPGDVAAVGPAASQYLARFMNTVSPHQRWRPSGEADYTKLIPALVAANKFPPSLDRQLKRELYIQYYARENGTELRRLGIMNNPGDLSDLGAQLNRIALSREDLAKQKSGPDVGRAIQAVNEALRAAGMDDEVPYKPLSFDLNGDGMLADESQRDNWVLVGSLEISLQSADPVPATYQATIKAKPSRRGEPEYELHGLPKAQFRAGTPFRWRNLPIGDLIVEIRRPNGEIVRREVTLRRAETILEPIVLGPSFPSTPPKGPAWILTDGHPVIRGGDLQGTMEGPPVPPFSGTATSAAFSDPAGKNSGSGSWDPLPPRLMPGQRVRIKMAASKQIVSMHWETGYEGRSRSFGVRDPWDPPRGTLDMEFEFQPKPGMKRFWVRLTSEPHLSFPLATRIRSVHVGWEYRLVDGAEASPAVNPPQTRPAPPSGPGGTVSSAGPPASPPGPAPGIGQPGVAAMRLVLESVTIDKRSARFPEKWTAEEGGTAIWATPWFDVKYRIQAPAAIGATGSSEIRIDAEITPRPGQSGTAYVKFFDSSHIVREPLDREMFVPAERGMANRASKMWRLKPYEGDARAASTVLPIGLGDGPLYQFRYRVERGSPAAVAARPPGSLPNPPPTGGGVVRPPQTTREAAGGAIELDRSTLGDFIRQTVPQGATAAGAARDGQTGNARNADDGCPPGKCGEILWDGDAQKGLLVTIDGSRVTTGTLEGGFPGGPVRIINDMPPDLLTIIEQPSARNGWKKLVFRLDFDGGFTFRLKWRSP